MEKDLALAKVVGAATKRTEFLRDMAGRWHQLCEPKRAEVLEQEAKELEDSIFVVLQTFTKGS